MRDDCRHRHREEPFLFFREGIEWRWWSFAESDEQVAEWRDALADLAPCSRVGIPGSPSTEAVLADLAVRSAGHLAAPIPPQTLQDDVVEGWNLTAVLDLGERRARVIEVARPEPLPGSAAPPGSSFRKEGGLQPSGGCLVSPQGDTPRSPRELSDSDLASAAEGVAERAGRTDQRPIVVHGCSLADAGERIVIEWATRTAAAIVISPTPEETAATVFWIRPTIVHGSARDLAHWPALFTAAEKRKRGLRARFKRLGSVLVTGPQALDPETAAFFADLGAKVAHVKSD